jgi:predicted membrane-bound spermidine synthase
MTQASASQRINNDPAASRNLWALGFAFFLSGLAALIYQIVWQRLLFAAFGVDIESVTVIVSIFMFGLGMGGFVGGFFADRYPARIPLLFCVTEFSIALFGFVSVGLIASVADRMSGSALPMTALIVFLLLGLPTLLMGATLPLLVSYSARSNGEVGVATGNLYFINTLGAAIGAVLTGFWLFHLFDLQQVARLAACANVVSSVWLLITVFGRKHA